MKNIEIVFNFLVYIILNYFGYSLIVIFQFFFIDYFPFIYHITQLFFSNICLYLQVKIHLVNNYVIDTTVINNKTNKIENQKTKEKVIIGENVPIYNINSIPNNSCNICKIEKLPLRSHHCEICNKCVKCFDHHCRILAGCIGESNRLLFILFLFFQNCSIDFSLIPIIILLSRQRNEKILYLLTFCFSFLCLFSIIFKFIFIYHSYLFFTNQTNYELINEDKCFYITYLNTEKKRFMKQINDDNKYRPFDLGIKDNLLLYFNQIMSEEKKDINWEEIYFDNLKNKNYRKKNDYIFDNIQ